MAKESANSFGQYSGIDRLRQAQELPNAVQRQDVNTREAVRNVAPWALGSSERGGSPSGRPWGDPSRQADRWVRGFGSAGQTQAAEEAQQQQDEADPIEAARRRAFGPRNQAQRGFNPNAVIAPVIPQTVANPGGADAGPVAYQPIAPPPNIFVNPSTSSPAVTQSQYSIGAALNGGGLTLPAYQLRIPTNRYL